MKIIRNLFGKTNSKRQMAEFIEVGFHGDQYLINIVNHLISMNTKYFIETGSNVGSTLSFVAKDNKDLSCLSCEPDLEAYKLALKNNSEHKNIEIFNELSQDFIVRLQNEYQHTFDEKVLFWIDAHGYGFEWPLKEEIDFVLNNYTNAYILIDDFKVPHNDKFGFDEYKIQVCSHEYIKDSIPDIPYKLYYPNYSEKTSKHHPLRGWGLFVTGEVDTFTKYPDKHHVILQEDIII